jgi:diacylglycerol kinase (ATP)
VRYSLQGLGDACRREAAFRQELALAAVLVPAALLLPFSAVERVLLIGSLLLVLIVELLNSAIEATVDRISLDDHPMAARAKDLGSAAVMLTLALALITWAGIAGPVLFGLLSTGG